MQALRVRGISRSAPAIFRSAEAAALAMVGAAAEVVAAEATMELPPEVPSDQASVMRGHSTCSSLEPVATPLSRELLG